jgi:hypothetical protein
MIHPYCLIDNWSLSDAATLLYDDYVIQGQGNLIDFANPASLSLIKCSDFSNYRIAFPHALASLSNLIDAIIFYDEPSFIDNGFNRHSWALFPRFSNTVEQVLKKKAIPQGLRLPPELVNNNLGLDGYLSIARYFESDVFISPLRTTLLFDQCKQDLVITLANDLLFTVDKAIKNRLSEIPQGPIKASIFANLTIPSLIQYIINESNRADDILTIACQLREWEPLQELRKTVRQILDGKSVSKDYLTLGRKITETVNDTIDKILGKRLYKEIPLSFDVKVFKISYLLKIADKKIMWEGKYSLFFRRLAESRLQAINISEKLEKIFGNQYRFKY